MWTRDNENIPWGPASFLQSAAQSAEELFHVDSPTDVEQAIEAVRTAAYELHWATLRLRAPLRLRLACCEACLNVMKLANELLNRIDDQQEAYSLRCVHLDRQLSAGDAITRTHHEEFEEAHAATIEEAACEEILHRPCLLNAVDSALLVAQVLWSHA